MCAKLKKGNSLFCIKLVKVGNFFAYIGSVNTLNVFSVKLPQDSIDVGIGEYSTFLSYKAICVFTLIARITKIDIKTPHNAPYKKKNRTQNLEEEI